MPHEEPGFSATISAYAVLFQVPHKLAKTLFPNRTYIDLIDDKNFDIGLLGDDIESIQLLNVNNAVWREGGGDSDTDNENHEYDG